MTKKIMGGSGIICSLLQSDNHASISWHKFLQVRCCSRWPTVSKHWR